MCSYSPTVEATEEIPFAAVSVGYPGSLWLTPIPGVVPIQALQTEMILRFASP